MTQDKSSSLSREVCLKYIICTELRIDFDVNIKETVKKSSKSEFLTILEKRKKNNSCTTKSMMSSKINLIHDRVIYVG